MSHFVVAGDAIVDGGDRCHARAPTAGQQRYHQLAHFVGISPLTMTDFWSLRSPESLIYD